jgi:hypothetical protein
MAARDHIGIGIPDAGWFTYPVIEGVVERINGMIVFTVGSGLMRVIALMETPPVPFARVVSALTNAVQQLETFVNPQSTVVDLPYAMLAARQIIELWKPLLSEEAIQLRAQTNLSNVEIEHARLIAQHFTSVLFAELPQADIYYISQKRAYKMSKFLAEAESVLPTTALEYLSPRTIADVRGAGRCIAFDEHTAAGFHAVRAVESVARCYYELILDKPPTKTSPLGPKPKRLYDLIDELTEKAENMPNPLEHPLSMISGDLNRIRAVYRNPIMHPEMVLNDDHAIRVFNITTDVIFGHDFRRDNGRRALRARNRFAESKGKILT